MNWSQLPAFRSPESMVEALQPSEPIYCVRYQNIRKIAKRFLSGFSGEVLYAVKCNAEEHVLGTLFNSGIRHFDVASLTEIRLIKTLFEGAHVYFMHPIKSRKAIRSAYYEYGVRHFSVDHVSELNKITESLTDRAGIVIVIRIAVENLGAKYELSSKFGADIESALDLIKKVTEQKFSYGVAFHVGSQCTNPEGYKHGLNRVGEVLSQVSKRPVCIDIGGGFPVDYVNSKGPPLETYFAAIQDGVAGLRLSEPCQLLCEPGRALAADGESIVVQVHLRKGDSIYLNDGLYGSMIEEKYGLRLPIRMVKSRTFSNTLRSYVAYGPTCDALDVYPARLELPEDLQEGDWIEFGLIGAYSAACRTQFNGFYPNEFVSIQNDYGMLD